MRNVLAALCLTVAFSVTAASQQSPHEFLGHPVGERFTPHHRILAYFEHLDTQSQRVRFSQFGESYEGRPLNLAVITSEQNHARLDEIRRQNLRLNDPRTISAADAGSIIRTAPVIVWLAYGVHGDESSSAEAAMLAAHWLATSADDELLRNVVVIIDPLQNPDGRERYINSFHQRRGRTPNPDPASVEHDVVWPTGRTNHYLIDMNRDWAWTTQKETLARVEAVNQWWPQVFVDFHEMGAESTYFFPPGAPPINEHVPPGIERWLDVFGRGNAEVFAANGWPFFVGERFDLFYPAYGDSWPSLRGAIGMTYEVSGGRRGGTHYRRDDDSVLTLAFRAQQHFSASIATVKTAAANRQAILEHQHKSARDTVSRSRTYLFSPSAANADALVSLLRRQRIEIAITRKPYRGKTVEIRSGRAASENLPAGMIAVTTAQPLGNLVNTLFERSPRLDPAFVEAQKERVAADEEDEFYDITAWSLPLVMNVATHLVEGAVDSTPIDELPRAAAPSRAAYAYLISPLQSDFFLVIGRLLSAGVKFSVAENTISAALPRGTVVVERFRNGAALDAQVGAAIRGTDVDVVPVERAWVEAASLGSDRVRFVRDPKIAIISGDRFDSSAVGMIWHTLDVQLEVPHSRISLDVVGGSDLAKYRVVVLPDGDLDLEKELGKSGVENLKRWVEAGGTVVAIKGGAAALREKAVGLSKLREWDDDEKSDGDDKDAEPEESERHNDYRIPGAAFRTTVNERSYLTFGIESAPVVLLEGSTALAPLAKKADNIVTIAASDPLAAGFAWPESIERIRNAPYLTRERVGDGAVITFADEPFYRLFWRSSLPLLMNAVIYSPTFNE